MWVELLEGRMMGYYSTHNMNLCTAVSWLSNGACVLGSELTLVTQPILYGS